MGVETRRSQKRSVKCYNRSKRFVDSLSYSRWRPRRFRECRAFESKFSSSYQIPLIESSARLCRGIGDKRINGKRRRKSEKGWKISMEGKMTRRKKKKVKEAARWKSIPWRDVDNPVPCQNTLLFFCLPFSSPLFLRSRPLIPVYSRRFLFPFFLSVPFLLSLLLFTRHLLSLISIAATATSSTL